MHAYLVTGKTHKLQIEWASQFFKKAKIQEIVNITPDTPPAGRASKNIVIESIRQLTRRLSFVPQDPGAGRGVVVENAHLLTTEAANAFLKTLEEPPGKTIFVLTAPNKDVVLETIASRANHIDLGPTDFEITDDEKQEAEKLFEKLTKSGVGEGLQFLDSIANRNEATKFCINQLFVAREKMLQEISKQPPSTFYSPLIYSLTSTLRDLEASINVKLTLGNLLLNYQ